MCVETLPLSLSVSFCFFLDLSIFLQYPLSFTYGLGFLSPTLRLSVFSYSFFLSFLWFLVFFVRQSSFLMFEGEHLLEEGRCGCASRLA